MRNIYWKVLIFIAVVLSCNFSAGLAKPVEATYRTVIDVNDWGPTISKVIVDIGSEVDEGAVDKETFKVYVKRSVPHKESAGTSMDLSQNSSTITEEPKILGDREGYREIKNVYVSDKNGQASKKGHYIVIEMQVGPKITLGLPWNFDLKAKQNKWIDCTYTITQQKPIKSAHRNVEGLIVTKFAGSIKSSIDAFTFDKVTYNDITLSYGSFEPKDKEKHPLIIWLHGMGEGGTDASIAVAGNKAVNFADPKIQAYFGGAYVLVPQAKTFWMDGFHEFGDGTSKYEDSLMALIRNYVSLHKEIDSNRIYLGGDSNGGYMTMLLIRDYPKEFAAAFPTCEALKDSLITDEDIEKMKTVPIWFTAAKTDEVVPPIEYVIPTYQRLVSAGANVQFSFFDNVSDRTGLYKKADGTPFEYNGHWSWIYVYNNDCIVKVNDKQISLMEWLAKQQRF